MRTTLIILAIVGAVAVALWIGAYHGIGPVEFIGGMWR